MALVRYARYRQYESQRTVANDAMMGLLVGSQLASHTLQLTQGSHKLIGEIFPSVPHIARFNMKTEAAKSILDDAENYLGAMAIPYALAIHEDYLSGVLELLNRFGKVSKGKLDGLRSAEMHEHLEFLTGKKFTAETLELFHLMRLVRNTQIHSGGTADGSLVNRLGQTSTSALTLWRGLTKQAFPTYAVGDLVRPGLQDLIGTLAITKRLAEEANMLLQGLLSAEEWAELVVEEWQPERRPGNPGQLLRQVQAVARRHYKDLQLTKNQLQEAMRRFGVGM